MLKKEEQTISSPFSSNPSDKKCELNIRAQIATIEKHSLFPANETTRELLNPFTNKTATLQQSSDLLNFRFIGEQEFLKRVTYLLRSKRT